MNLCPVDTQVVRVMLDTGPGATNTHVVAYILISEVATNFSFLLFSISAFSCSKLIHIIFE
jgi:hypothetical protein